MYINREKKVRIVFFLFVFCFSLGSPLWAQDQSSPDTKTQIEDLEIPDEASLQLDLQEVEETIEIESEDNVV